MRNVLQFVSAWCAERRFLAPAKTRMPAGWGGWLFVVCSCLVLAGAASGQPVAPPRGLRVVMDDNYPPFVFRDDEGKLQGIVIDQWRLWEKATGVKVRIEGTNWSEALRRMRAGEFDVIDTIFKTDARIAYFEFTKPYARLEVPIFFRRDISGITDLASLKGFPVAAKTSDAAVDLLQQHGVAPVLLFSNYQAIITAAKEHKVNVFVMDEPPALYYLNKLGIEAGFRMTAPVDVGDFHRAVLKGNTPLLQQVEAGFAGASPAELQRINEKWYGQKLNVPPYGRWLGYAALGVTALLALLVGWNWTLARRVRRRTEELRESQALLQGVIENSPSLIFIKDLAGTYLLANKLFQTQLVAGPANLAGKTDFDIFPRELAESYRRDDQTVAESGAARLLEETVPHADGKHHYFTIKFPLRDAAGRIFAVAGIATDITERKQAERALQISDERLQQAIRAGSIGIFDHDHLTDTIYCSPEQRRIYDWDPEEPVTLPKYLQSVHAEDRARIAEAVQRAHDPAGDGFFDVEHRIVKRSGAVRWLNTRSVTGFEGEGKTRHKVRSVGAVVDITERKQAEAALRASEDRYRRIVETSEEGIWMIDAEARTAFVNPKMAQMLGYTVEEMQGRALNDFMDEAGRAITAENIRRRQQGITEQHEFKFLRKDGSELWTLLAANPVLDAGGAYAGALAMVTDITERRQAEQHIRRLNRVYSMLSDVNQTIVREKDPQAMMEAVCRIAVEKGSFRMAWIGRFHPATQELKPIAASGVVEGYTDRVRIDLRDPAQTTGPTARCLQSGEHAVCNDIAHDPGYQPWRAEALRRGYQSSAGFPLKVEGQVVGVFNLYAVEPEFFDAEELGLLDELAADISFALEVSQHGTERVMAEAARDALLDLQLKLSAARAPLEVARSIFAAADQLWKVDAGSLNVYLPEQDLVQVVLNFDLVAGRRQDVRLVEIIGPPTPRLRRVMQQGAELVLRPPDFTLQPDCVMFGDKSRPSASMMHVPIRWQERAVGILSVQSYTPNAFTEVDLRTLQGLADHCGGTLERIRADAALRASEARFRELADNINEVFWISDAAKRQALYVSPAYEKIWGRTCASLYAAPQSWLETIHAEDQARVGEAVASKQVLGNYDETYRILRPDGTVRWIHDRAFPIRNAAGDILRIVGTAEDITEQRQLEEQFRQSQKMEAIGQLAGGVAHDFNNILAAIMMQAELVTMTQKLPPAAQEYINEIKSSAERAANLTRQLLAFSRRQVMQMRQLDLNEIVTNLTKMLQRVLGADVRLQLNLHPQALLTRADPGMLDQVLLNLVVNARDAMPQGGRLTIETGERHFTAAEAAALPEAKPGPHVCLRVTDTGCGMSPEIKARIFEPFFTTKETGKGTGLGLATAFGIVKQHGGSLTVESQVGQGTTFFVFLPADESAKNVSPAESTQPAPRGGTETILLVEDEPALRQLIAAMLRLAGYEVLEAVNGVEALRVWEEHQNRIQLLFTDIVMPEGINGNELAARLLARKPKLKVVFTSGYRADFAGRELSSQESQNFLPKPFAPNQMLETVRRCLDE